MIKKIVFWIFVVVVGFLNPLFSIALVVLYYLPKIIQDMYTSCNDVSEPEMKSFSDDILEDMK
jgi:hypothetical protein